MPFCCEVDPWVNHECPSGRSTHPPGRRPGDPYFGSDRDLVTPISIAVAFTKGFYLGFDGHLLPECQVPFPAS